MSTITKRLSVAEYDRMIADGTIGEDDPVELIEGVVVPKMPRNPPHRVATRKTAKVLERLVPTRLVRRRARGDRHRVGRQARARRIGGSGRAGIRRDPRPPGRGVLPGGRGRGVEPGV